MPATLDAVAHDALILPPEQRLALARQLLDSVDLEPEPGAEAAWEAEIAQRIARFKAGESKPIPAGEVFALLRQIAPEHPSSPVPDEKRDELRRRKERYSQHPASGRTWDQVKQRARHD